MKNKKSNEESEDNSKMKISMNSLKSGLFIFKYIKPYLWQFIGGLVLLSASSLIFMVFPKTAGEMANAANGKSSWSYSVREYGFIFLIILIIQGIISYFRTTLFAIVSEKGMADLRIDLYRKIICSPMMYFEKRRVGELSSRITADVGTLQEAFTVTLAEFIRQIVILLAGVIILFWTTPKLSLIMLMTFPVIVIVAMFFGKYVRKLSKNRQDLLASTNVIVDESFQTFQTVKAFSNESFEVKRYDSAIQSLVQIALRLSRVKGVFFTFIITILFGGIFFILWQGAIMVEKGEMKVGDLFSFIIYTGLIGGAIASIGNLYTALAGAIGATERVKEIMEEPDEINTLEERGNRINIQGNIKYEAVKFNYPARPEMEVLKGVDFEIKAGQKVALVGSSGSGKSTIVQLLMRFYPLTGGNVFVDGLDVQDYPIRQFRENFAIVPQEVLLFGGTIKENIQYGKPEASEMEVIESAKQANAWDFISTFPEGLETIVGERGVKLSGGQRQRIAIARALLKNPAILILDEATSSLDAESEKTVQDALEILMTNRTTIIIAHRLATIKDVDCIFVLEDGQIVERGTHEELIGLKNGVYAHLAKLQFE